jgi:hypothetical protein
MISPAVAGLVIAAIGTGWAFLFNGASFRGRAGVARLPAPPAGPVRGHRAKGKLHRGLPLCLDRPDLKAILLMLFLIGPSA